MRKDSFSFDRLSTRFSFISPVIRFSPSAASITERWVLSAEGGMAAENHGGKMSTYYHSMSRDVSECASLRRQAQINDCMTSNTDDEKGMAIGSTRS